MEMEPDRTLKIAVICPTILNHDAVGNATQALVDDLRQHDGWEVTLIARNSDRKDGPIVIVRSLGELLLTPAFRHAAVIIYVFAIYNDLFDAMLIGNGHAVQFVRFHNVTPKSFVSESDHDVIDRSLAQIQNFLSADEIWADSHENHDELMRRGISDEKIRIMPLAVEPLVVAAAADKPSSGPLRILYVGRFVQSKGLEDLIDAFGLLKRKGDFDFVARLLGSTRHSPRPYLNRLENMITAQGLQNNIEMGGTVTQTALAEAYRDAHIVVTASRHEGFCVPIIEGMAAGCVPVTYANSNLNHIADGLGLLARENTPQSLANALFVMGRAVQRSTAGDLASLPLDRGPMTRAGFDEARAAHVAKFAPDVCARRVRERIATVVAKPVPSSTRPAC